MKVYLAAFETQHGVSDVMLDKDQSLFCTYYYRRLTDKSLQVLKPEGHRGTITIDSGAHSFFEQAGVSVTGNKSKETKKTKDPDLYFASYLAWVKEFYDLFDYFVELDIGELIGNHKIEKWREIMKEEGVFAKCITVHHTNNTMEEYKALLKDSESGYIGIEGIRPGQKMLPYNRLLKLAYEAQVKVHGFAFTRAQLLKLFPFYSVDSSSWTMCLRFGGFQKFIDGNMKSVNCSKKEHFFKYNIPIELHSMNRSREANRFKLEQTAKEYAKMEIYFTKLWEKRGVNWND